MSSLPSSRLDEDAFGEKKDNFGALRTFDAFPKTKPTYTRRSVGGGYATMFLAIFSTLMCFSEFASWWVGSETQQFSVEKGVSHTMQINLDAVVRMKCEDLDINVQDAAGDRIVAKETLTREGTMWWAYMNPNFRRFVGKEKGKYASESAADMETLRRLQHEEEDTHAGHVIGEVKHAKRKFPKTAKVPKNIQPDACRIFGSIEGNKVQGDFHITARGHGYPEFGGHVAHESFNFSHVITELSFGPYYPSILNPLDDTVDTTESTFYRYQYYLSIVPTIYTSSSRAPSPYAPGPPSSGVPARDTSDNYLSRDAVRTNQYAVTTHNLEVPEYQVPGIFFKYDIEPIMLTIVATRGDFLSLIVRVVNVASGVLVGGGWIYQLWGWGREVTGLRIGRSRAKSLGMLHGRHDDSDGGED